MKIVTKPAARVNGMPHEVSGILALIYFLEIPEPGKDGDMSAKSLKTAKKPSGTGQRERAQHGIEKDIARGFYKAGQRLDEREIAARYHVSRTPVREALNRLVSDGLAEARLNQGCFVASMTFQNFLQQYEYMGGLEAFCAKLASKRMSDAERNKLMELVQSGKDASARQDIDGYAEVNIDFHQLIYAGARNRYLEAEVLKNRRRLAHYRGFSFRVRGRTTESAEEHALIAAAIVRGDEDEAYREMRRHLELLRPEAATFLMQMAEVLSPSG